MSHPFCGVDTPVYETPQRALLGLFINQVSPPIGIRPEFAPQLREILDIAATLRDDLVGAWALLENLVGTGVQA
jgi:hypothetical protein